MFRWCWIPLLVVGFVGLPQSASADDGEAKVRAAQERMEAMAREANQLREQGKQEQAEQLMAKVRQWREEIAQAKSAHVRSAREKTGGARAAIEKRLAQLKNELAGAKKKGIKEKVADLEHAIAETTRDMAVRARDAARDRLELVEQKIRQLREQGKGELAEKMLQQLRRTRQTQPQPKQQATRRQPQRRPSPRISQRDVAKRRLEMAEKKIHELREQGKDELAEKMLQQLRRTRQTRPQPKQQAVRRQPQRRPSPQVSQRDVAKRGLEMAEKKIHELREQGKGEEADRLVQQLRRPRHTPPQRPAIHPPRRQPSPEAREVAQRRQMERMEHEIHELHARGNHEGAEKIEQQLHRMRGDREHREVARHEPPQRGPSPEDRERAEMKQRLDRIHAAAELLEPLGMQDVIQRLAEEAGEIERALRGPQPPEREEMERRMEHLHAAAENLAAIGMNDLADRLAGEAADIDRELHGRGHEPGPVPPDFAEQVKVRFDELSHHIDELNDRLNHVIEAVEGLQRER